VEECVSAGAVSSHRFPLNWCLCLAVEQGKLGHWFHRLASASTSRLTFADRTLLVGKTGLEQAKQALSLYKTGQVKDMTPELWRAKKIVDSTLHPGMKLPVGSWWC
jgi:hypothetical protein